MVSHDENINQIDRKVGNLEIFGKYQYHPGNAVKNPFDINFDCYSFVNLSVYYQLIKHYSMKHIISSFLSVALLHKCDPSVNAPWDDRVD